MTEQGDVDRAGGTMIFALVVSMVLAFGGYFLACVDFGRMFDNPFPSCAFLKKKVEIR